MIKMTFPGSNIVFVDTPGFDNNMDISDGDILKMISDWLEKTYVIIERTKDAADRLADLDSKEKYCLVASFIFIGYQTIAWLGPLSRT